MKRRIVGLDFEDYFSSDEEEINNTSVKTDEKKSEELENNKETDTREYEKLNDEKKNFLDLKSKSSLDIFGDDKHNNKLNFKKVEKSDLVNQKKSRIEDGYNLLVKTCNMFSNRYTIPQILTTLHYHCGRLYETIEYIKLNGPVGNEVDLFLCNNFSPLCTTQDYNSYFANGMDETDD